jgi:hypothetical protein
VAVGPTGCDEAWRRVCLFTWNFIVTRSTVFTGAERRTSRNMTLSLH